MTKIVHFEDSSVIADTADWQSVLALMTYTLTDIQEVEGYQFQIFERKQDWALYQPPIAGLDDTECVFTYVPTADKIENLIHVAEQMILPITTLAEMRAALQKRI